MFFHQFLSTIFFPPFCLHQFFSKKYFCKFQNFKKKKKNWCKKSKKIGVKKSKKIGVKKSKKISVKKVKILV